MSETGIRLIDLAAELGVEPYELAVFANIAATPVATELSFAFADEIRLMWSARGNNADTVVVWDLDDAGTWIGKGPNAWVWIIPPHQISSRRWHLLVSRGGESGPYRSRVSAYYDPSFTAESLMRIAEETVHRMSL